MNTTLYNRAEVVRRALASKTNTPYYCQLWTREIIGAPSAGDVDHDGDSDAVDGWLSEPAEYRHPGDRQPPAGVSVAWSGGSHGNGHRAVTLGHGLIRSTDAGGLGHVATVPLAWVEQTWGLHYLGWAETMDGYYIPEAPAPKPPKPEPLTPEQKAKVVKRAARDAAKAGHPGWAARLRAWAKKITG